MIPIGNQQLFFSAPPLHWLSSTLRSGCLAEKLLQVLKMQESAGNFAEVNLPSPNCVRTFGVKVKTSKPKQKSL